MYCIMFCLFLCLDYLFLVKLHVDYGDAASLGKLAYSCSQDNLLHLTKISCSILFGAIFLFCV